MKNPKGINQLLMACATFAFGLQAWGAPVVLPGTVVNGTVSDAAFATDDDYTTRMHIQATGGPSARVSFVVDLGSEQPVHGVALYGDFVYRAAISMLSDEITVEGTDDLSQSWIQIGSINVGNTAPTDPDPSVGGVNPFTGGNGRFIPCTPSNARYLRISGGQGFGDDILIYHLQINPQIVIHQMSPINQGVSNQPFDANGGSNNSRVSVDMVDGKINTRTFIGVVPTMVLDIGTPKAVQEFRLLMAENDSSNVPETGTIRVSSTDDPLNIDTLETNFDGTGPGGNQHVVARVVLPNTPTKRFYEMTLLTNRDNQAPNGSGPTLRLSEIEYKTTADLPITTAAYVPGSAEGMTETTAAQILDLDYNTYGSFSQIDPATVGSFVVALGGSKQVSSVGIYGNWAYNAFTNMFSDDVIVEAGNSATGPWTQIGFTNVGNTRPTDPNPAIGGENPWTGGNGRRIPCLPTAATHLRISGGFGFDNLIRPYEVIVNPPLVLHTVTPVDQGQTLWDVGGGPRNGRVGAEIVDGDIQTRINPRIPFAATLDLGNAPVKVAKIRFYPYESDFPLLPKIGVVRSSSTDNPANMDTVEANFNVTYVGGGVIEVELPSQPEKRYLQVDMTESGRRLGEIEIIKALADEPLVPVDLSGFAID